MAAPKQPQDHKLKAAEADALKEPFHFEGLDGKTYELPYFDPADAGLSFGFIRKNRDNQAEVMYTLVEAMAGEEAIAALDEMTQTQAGEVIKSWQEASGAELPKS